MERLGFLEKWDGKSPYGEIRLSRSIIPLIRIDQTSKHRAKPIGDIESASLGGGTSTSGLLCIEKPRRVAVARTAGFP
jgi:hypothetical protein